jgi:hypothetical protein
MRNTKFIILSLLFFQNMHAQDSTATRHEIGFSTITLLRQISLINSTVATVQSPFDVFYNFYITDDFAIRTGLGLSTHYMESTIPEQALPRITKANDINWRLGGSYNFSKMGRIVLNGFLDYVMFYNNNLSVATTTSQTFPNPIVTRYVKSETESMEMGASVGVGVKWRMYRQLYLYAELPYFFTLANSKEEEIVSVSGKPEDKLSTNSKGWGSRFVLPATVYLVLRF